MTIVRQRTEPDAPEDGMIWIDTGNARIYERVPGLDAWARLTPDALAARLGTTAAEVLGVAEILAAVKDRTCSLRVANGQLEIVGAAALSDELIAEIHAHEAELIAALPEATLQPRRYFRENWSSWLDGPGYIDD